jgi:hypothetical protein
MEGVRVSISKDNEEVSKLEFASGDNKSLVSALQEAKVASNDELSKLVTAGDADIGAQDMEVDRDDEEDGLEAQVMTFLSLSLFFYFFFLFLFLVGGSEIAEEEEQVFRYASGDEIV